MKAAIVKLSTLVEHNCWLPGYYLEDPELPKALERKRRRAKAAIQAVRATKKAITDDKARVAQLVASGKVRRL